VSSYSLGIIGWDAVRPNRKWKNQDGGLLITGSPAGLALLMASAVVVLKHEIQTKSHSFIPINLTFCVGDNVREFISPAKFGSDPMSGRDATWGQHIRVRDFHLVFLFVFIYFNRATVHTREPIFAHNSSKDAVQCKEDPFGDENCVILKFGGVLP